MSRNYYVEEIEKYISEGKFNDKKSLSDFLKKVISRADENQEIKDEFKRLGIFDENDLEHKAFYEYFFGYYDKQMSHFGGINLDDVTSFTLEDQGYMKFKDEDGNYRVIENNEKNNFVEQVIDKQNESLMYQTSDSEYNRNEIMKDLAEERTEFELEEAATVNKNDLELEERNNYNYLMSHEDFKDREIVFNAEENIYIDKNTGETFTVIKNEFGQREIRRLAEDYATTYKVEVTGVDENGNEVTEEFEQVDTLYENLSDFDLDYLLENKNDSLTENQKLSIRKEIERRKQAKPIVNEIEKQKVMMKTFNKQYNGFTSFLVLLMILATYATGMLSYIFFLVK